jgi:hypothetical protein
MKLNIIGNNEINKIFVFIHLNMNNLLNYHSDKKDYLLPYLFKKNKMDNLLFFLFQIHH